MDVLDISGVHKNLLFLCITLIILLLLILVSNMLSSNVVLDKMHGKLANAVRQAVHLHKQANQTNDPSIILQQATQGLAYISLARKLANEDLLAQQTDVNIIQLEKELLDLQIAAANNTKSNANSFLSKF
jgi:hypothetical protein